MLFAGLVIAGCSTQEPEVSIPEDPENGGMNVNPDWDKDSITISFTRALETHIEPFDDSVNARTRGDISSSANRLDVWLIQGTDTTEVHQTSEDADFGKVTLTVNKQKEYTLKAVGHKCSAESVMKAGVVSFPAGEIKHTIYGQHTFKPDTLSGTIDMEMTRIVGMFKIDITDSIPSKVQTMQFKIKNSPQKFNTADSTGTSKADRTAVFQNLSRRTDGGAAFTIYVLPDDLKAKHNYDIEVKALKQNGDVVEERIFDSVDIRANYKTQYSGQLFVTKGATFTFSIGDWNEYTPVNF